MLRENDVVGNYQVLREIGQGGTGTIYLAFHMNLRKYVVLKRIRLGGGNVESLRRESDILKNLHHPYLPQIYDYLIEPNQIFTVMDYIDGRDFGKLPAGANEIPEILLIKWLTQLTDVLVYLEAQAEPIVHSDIKPQNIILRENGDICLIDFNISFAENVRDGIQGVSPAFASPEQLLLADYLMKGYNAPFQLDLRTDIYSIGATFYYLLTGREPFGGQAPMLSVYTGLSVSEGFVSLIDRCMAAEREKRFQNAAELKKALENLKKQDSRYKRYVALRVCTILVGAAFLALGTFFFFRGMQLKTREQFLAEVGTLTSLDEDEYEKSETLALEILNNESYAGIMRENPQTGAVIYSRLGDACYGLENLKDAEGYYREALSLARASGEKLDRYYRDLGLALANDNEMDAAADVIRAAKEEGCESSALAQIELAIAAREGKEENMLSSLHQILGNATDKEASRQALLSVAAFYIDAERYGEALSYLENARTCGRNRDVLRRLGSLFLKMATLPAYASEKSAYASNAYKVYQELCGEENVPAADRVNLAIALRALGRNTEASEELERVLIKDPDNCAALLYLAIVRRDAGYRDFARETAERAMVIYEKLSPSQRQKLDGNLVEAVREILE